MTSRRSRPEPSSGSDPVLYGQSQHALNRARIHSKPLLTKRLTAVARAHFWVIFLPPLRDSYYNKPSLRHQPNDCHSSFGRCKTCLVPSAARSPALCRFFQWCSSVLLPPLSLKRPLTTFT